LNSLNALTPLNRRLWVIAGALFLYVVWIRVYDVSSTFLMLGEQTRDWTVALGGLTDLPLVGAPSTAGGRGFGPAYYWLLWMGRMLLGPFMDNLPHAGGVTVALLQSIADTWLFLALSRRVHWGLALAMCLLIASAPFDIAISSVIWNPPVAAALIKMAMAMALTLTAASPRWHVAITAALAWMAVQSHLSALFVAAPLLAAIVIQSIVEPSSHFRRTIVERALIVVGVLVVLQIPFLISMLREPSAPAGPTSAIAGLVNPKAFRPWFAYDSIVGITGNLVWPAPDAFKYSYPSLLLAVIVAIAYRKDLIVVAMTTGAIVAATLLFTTSTRNYDGYWFIPFTAALTLTFGMALAAIPSKAAVKWMGFAVLAFVVWRQPLRIEDSKRFFKYQQYDTMLRGSRQLIMQAPSVRDIKVTFEVHPTMDRQFIYKILGGRIDGAALYTAVINADGSVRLE
jgi:hypothetical protein